MNIDPELTLEDLPGKEQDLLRCLADGLSNKQIASKLGIGMRTVELWRAKLRQRFGVDSMFQLGMVYAELVGPLPLKSEAAEPERELSASF